MKQPPPKKLIQRFVLALYRGPNEAFGGGFNFEPRLRRIARLKVLFFALLITTSLSFFAYLFLPTIPTWKLTSVTPSVVISRTMWRFTNEGVSPCSQSDVVDSNCLASPDNPTLWSSVEDQTPKTGHFFWRSKDNFWSGVQFSVDDVRRARGIGANQLILGTVYGTSEIFINGVFQFHSMESDRLPIVLSLPVTAFAENRDLKIAIHIHPMGPGFNNMTAWPWKEGLATSAETAAFRSALVYWRRSIPMALFSANLILGFMFFLFWFLNQSKQEYFYIACYCGAMSIVQSRIMDIFSNHFETLTVHLIDCVSYGLQGGLSLVMALSFARSRKSLMAVSLPLLLIAPVTTEALNQFFKLGLNVSRFMQDFVVPICLIAGGAVCAIQAFYVILDSQKNVSVARSIRLCVFAAGMFAMAIIFTSRWMGGASFVLSGIGHLAIIILLGATAIIEYHYERKLLERAPLSKYHRMQELPAVISGLVLSVDLKNSEHFSRIEAQRGEPGKIVAICLSRIWASVLQQNGVVIESTGDGLLAIFEARDESSESLSTCVESALVATDKIQKDLAELHHQLTDQSILVGSMQLIEFRAAISVGSLKPVWRDIGGLKVAGWIEAGSTNSLVESSRLMDVEKSLATERNKFALATESTVIVLQTTAELVKSSDKLSGVWLYENREAEGKHKYKYVIASYRPGAQSKPNLALISA